MGGGRGEGGGGAKRMEARKASGREVREVRGGGERGTHAVRFGTCVPLLTITAAFRSFRARRTYIGLANFETLTQSTAAQNVAAATDATLAAGIVVGGVTWKEEKESLGETSLLERRSRKRGSAGQGATPKTPSCVDGRSSPRTTGTPAASFCAGVPGKEAMEQKTPTEIDPVW